MCPTRVFPADFLSDLHAVCNSLPPTKQPRFLLEDDANLHFLAEHFQSWRTRTQARVRTELARLSKDDPLLSKDDPLFCPVSLFRTMDFGRLETAHTRTLAWLLDRTKEHGFNDRLLAALLRHLHPDGFNDLSVRPVESEFPVKTSDGAEGRLDVLAEGRWDADGFPREWVLVIEAKIDALEGEDQLAKYDKWLDDTSQNRHVLRVFLTPEGRAGSSPRAWTALSYPRLVQVFRGVYSELHDTPGFHFLRYYLASVIQDICRWPRPRELSEHAPDPYAVVAYLEGVSLS